jgi:hypothetical protein
MKTVIISAATILLAGYALAQDACPSIAACAQDAVEAAENARLSLQVATPKGAVVAFNLETCPAGWTEFIPAQGRMIVGVGNSEDLSPRGLGDQGGTETHTLTVSEMPPHNHGYVRETEFGTQRRPSVSGQAGRTFVGVTDDRTGSSGAGAPHNNMPPYYALLFCERL